MQRVEALNPETTTGKSKEFFNAVNAKFGVVPNMIRTMGNSPAVLEGYLSFSGALDKSSIGSKLNKLIALAIANANQCDYCNAIHSYLGEKLLKLDNETILLAKAGESENEKTKAALSFALSLTRKRGHVDEADVFSLKAAGFNDAQITEIIAAAALNIFTNYFNSALEVAVDFPAVELAESVSVI
jgi:uncharacterized peroxidase-related enzyme